MASTIHQRFVSRLPSLEQEMGEELFVSGLVGPYRIFQRKNGHRHGIDDATTAWYALQKSPPVKNTLDLGTGIGTVGLAVLWALGQGAKLTCVEAQETSYRLLTENILGNGLNECVRAIHGDIRDLDLGERFPLITGSPPYFPIGTGSLPEDSQKAHARFELRGDVGDYARAAKRHITEDGLFVFLFSVPTEKQVHQAGDGCGVQAHDNPRCGADEEQASVVLALLCFAQLHRCDDRRGSVDCGIRKREVYAGDDRFTGDTRIWA